MTLTICILFYLAAFVAQAQYLRAYKPIYRVMTLSTTLVAALLQMGLLHAWIDTSTGQNLDVFNLINFITWLWVVITLISCIRTRIESSLFIVIPMNVLSILLVKYYAGQTVIPLAQSPAELWHIIFALLAYAIFGVACLQACVLGLQLQWLSKHPGKRYLQAMPPVEGMQQLMFNTLLMGMLVFTIAMSLGFVFAEQGGQLYVSKGGLSLLAWVIYFGLLLAYYKFGLKLRLAVLWTILAWVGLSLAYFGTRIL